MANSQASIPPASVKQPAIKEVTAYPPHVAGPVPAEANPAHYLTYVVEEITLPGTAGPIFAGNIYRPRPVHWARVTVSEMGTATDVKVGNKDATYSMGLTAALKQFELRAPSELRFDLNKLFLLAYVEASTSTTTKIIVEYLE